MDNLRFDASWLNDLDGVYFEIWLRVTMQMVSTQHYHTAFFFNEGQSILVIFPTMLIRVSEMHWRKFTNWKCFHQDNKE